MNDTEMEVEIILEDEMKERTLAQIRQRRSFFGPVSSATFLKSLSEEGTLGSLKRKVKHATILGSPSNLLSQSSSTSQENGKEIVMKNDYWEYHSQE